MAAALRGLDSGVGYRDADGAIWVEVICSKRGEQHTKQIVLACGVVSF
jgi:hypothetical protein